MITNYTGSRITLQIGSGRRTEEVEVLNFGNFDFMGLGARQELKDASKKALEMYGCGSCGPRGFYGTIKPHITLEETFAAFVGVDNSIMYSDGASTSSSTVAAFAKRGDLLVVDEGIYEGLLTGVTLSRSNVKTFKHNDMVDLERVLTEVRKEDVRLKRNVLDQRRFIVCEGLYRNYGTILKVRSERASERAKRRMQ